MNDQEKLEKIQEFIQLYKMLCDRYQLTLVSTPKPVIDGDGNLKIDNVLSVMEIN